MAKNLVLCADGTCNAFGSRVSNVARMLRYIELSSPETQAVCYDQGLGTRRGAHRAIRKFAKTLGKRSALDPLKPPKESWLRPWTWKSLIAAMAYGTGIDAHVRTLYVALSTRYQGSEAVYLFGFSRGAFAVRALAGLVWRYGLPAAGAPDAGARFDEAWRLFTNEFPDEDGAAAAKAAAFQQVHKQRPCPIHFVGLWDTVKSYGGLRPVMLPHLRHNPSVAIVRHALSLDEQRGWFELTTWGWLDADQQVCAAASRVAPADAECINGQDVVEVWFNGCHADVGGGAGNDGTADIALRWMLGEAKHVGLELNDAGDDFLRIPAGCEHPTVAPSRTLFWRVVERKQRLAIVNAGRWPARVIAPRGASPRHPVDAIRRKTLWYHESATDLSRLAALPTGVELRMRETRRTPAAGPTGPAGPY